jgi:isocitrate dehydrogenase kinase/phosphatase
MGCQAMSDDVSFIEWGFKGLVAVVLTVGGWLWTKLVGAVGKTKDDLAEYKVHVADNYIKKDVVERIHDRIDDLADKNEVEKVRQEMSEIRKGVTQILQMMAGNGRTKTTD